MSVTLNAEVVETKQRALEIIEMLKAEFDNTPPPNSSLQIIKSYPLMTLSGYIKYSDERSILNPTNLPDHVALSPIIQFNKTTNSYTQDIQHYKNSKEVFYGGAEYLQPQPKNYTRLYDSYGPFHFFPCFEVEERY